MRRRGALSPVAGPGDGDPPAPASGPSTEARGTTGDSLRVAAGTGLSRVTGVLRVLVVGAVLGPTWFGNAYQVTNSLPNLIYYGFLAGSLVSSLLVPLLVRQLDLGRSDRAGAMCGGFLGVIFIGATVVIPLAAWGLPRLLAVVGSDSGDPGGQAELARFLVLMTLPQIYLYAVAGTGAAVLYANRRFTLASLAPAAENLGVIAVLAAVAVRYGSARNGAGDVPAGELLLLGLGSTAAVGLHAGLQWWGALRCGVTLRPRRGWRDPEVRVALGRAGHSVAQAGLLALQVLALLLVASRISGGAVALQIALNFYYLPLAMVATPVGIALLPRLSRLDQAGATVDYLETLLRGLMLALFVVLPASAGYVVAARPIAHVVAVGQMATPEGLEMIATALVALSFGLVGQAVFFIATQASYARGDTTTPLRSMALQTVVCCALCAVAMATARGTALLPLVAGAYAAASLIAGAHLLLRVVQRSASFLWRLVQSVTRVAAGIAVMLLPLLAMTSASPVLVDGRAGWALGLAASALTALLCYLAVQAVLRAPELHWLRHDAVRATLDSTGDAP